MRISFQARYIEQPLGLSIAKGLTRAAARNILFMKGRVDFEPEAGD